MRERAISLDIDGVVLFRPPLQLGAVINRHVMRCASTMYNSPDAIPQIMRAPVPGNIKAGELISFLMHYLKWVYPGARDFIRNQEGVYIYGNTGRKNKVPWVELTKKILGKGRVLDRFEHIFFKEAGTKTMLRKLDAVNRLTKIYPHVTHYDDNPADALPIAAFFPDVEVVIVQDLSAGVLYSSEELAKYPNVRKIAGLKAA